VGVVNFLSLLSSQFAYRYRTAFQVDGLFHSWANLLPSFAEDKEPTIATKSITSVHFEINWLLSCKSGQYPRNDRITVLLSKEDSILATI
jgi:hypothetical protein